MSNNEELKPCPFCGGKGLVQIAPFARGLKKCPHCGGNGREANNPEIPDCSSDSEIPNFTPDELDLIRKAMVRFYNIEKRNPQSAGLAEGIAAKCERMLEEQGK